MGMSAQKKNDAAMNKRNRSKVRQPSYHPPPTDPIGPAESPLAVTLVRPDEPSAGSSKSSPC